MIVSDDNILMVKSLIEDNIKGEFDKDGLKFEVDPFPLVEYFNGIFKEKLDNFNFTTADAIEILKMAVKKDISVMATKIKDKFAGRNTTKQAG